MREHPSKEPNAVVPVVVTGQHVRVPDKVDIHRWDKQRVGVLTSEFKKFDVVSNRLVDGTPCKNVRAESNDLPVKVQLAFEPMRKLRYRRTIQKC
mmetsp:Transcript_29151/g.68685  ORF Transcript_29151/g.68685 Transcript_29151/m.68685 type:complete len:95 (-) Transcript_29151:25-309(-)